MAKLLLIPAGPGNIKNYFPDIDWKDIKDYYIEVIDRDDAIIATTNVVKNCRCAGDGVRIHFMNSLGTFDTINFRKPLITSKDESKQFRKGLSVVLQKRDTGIERYDVRSNDVYEARRHCSEKEMEWIRECQNSVKAFIEWEGTELQSDDYMPIVIMDSELIKLKNVQDYIYEYVIRFQLANEYTTIRN